MLTKKKLLDLCVLIGKRVDILHMTMETNSRIIDELNKQIKDIRSIHEATLKLMRISIPHFAKIEHLQMQYNALENKLKENKLACLDRYIIEEMQHIEKEIELIVYPNKEAPSGPSD